MYCYRNKTKIAVGHGVLPRKKVGVEKEEGRGGGLYWFELTNTFKLCG